MMSYGMLLEHSTLTKVWCKPFKNLGKRQHRSASQPTEEELHQDIIGRSSELSALSRPAQPLHSKGKIMLETLYYHHTSICTVGRSIFN
ncbi:hypothetical protein DPMN_018749 [Dreissena polymorpha]|uniref:Uncharacterized protein n=1 Tax=Dreissena polymorpha TaxID=45954 RepID=A0A9D4NDS3_DREPO|nr:hypothetical protein DPMN_018749 [Dreissena polymorpha]